MATIFRNEELNFQEDDKVIDNYRLFTAVPRFSNVVNSKNLFFDMRLLNPGQFAFPYHFHRHAEELMLITSGTMTLRTEKGFEIIKQGDVIYFEMGESGVHQFYNHSDKPCTYLDVRTFLGVDVCEYPDSGKINILPSFDIFEKDKIVNYFTNEENPLNKWDELRQNNS